MSQPDIDRKETDYQEELISELKKNSEDLCKLLNNIIHKTNGSSELKDNAQKSIKSIDELISFIENQSGKEIRNIAVMALSHY